MIATLVKLKCIHRIANVAQTSKLLIWLPRKIAGFANFSIKLRVINLNICSSTLILVMNDSWSAFFRFLSSWSSPASSLFQLLNFYKDIDNRNRTAMMNVVNNKIRCTWAGDTQIYINYHDHEWGRPVHDDCKLFEMLILEGMQAGLTWITVLKKREEYRRAFDNFDPVKVAIYDDAKLNELMANPGIIRNRLKIQAAITNAKALLDVVKIHGSFDKFIWAYVDHQPIIGRWETMADLPASTPLSNQISKDLKKLGFKFVGSTIIYSFMQAIGMVNDHLTNCFLYDNTNT